MKKHAHSSTTPLLWQTPEDVRPERLDKWLARQESGMSRSQIQRHLREGRVQIDGRVASPRENLPANACITLQPDSPEPPSGPEPEAGYLDILFEDEHVVALHKPAGLVVHPAPGHPGGTLVNRLLAAYPDISNVGPQERPGLVHRLDADTSGVLVVARTTEALEHLKAQFKQRDVRKTYTALCHGIPASISGTIDAPIGRHPVRRKKQAVDGDGAREAISHYRVLNGEAAGRAARLEVRIDTGRTHQIRVHLAHIGHPVLGDSLYAGKKQNLPTPNPTAPRQMLHASVLELTHPVNGSPLKCLAPLPDDFVDYLNRLNAV